MTKTSRLILLSAIIFISGCATEPLPSTTEIKAAIASYPLPKLPPPGKAMVYVVRPNDTGWLVRFNVFVDNPTPDAEVGYTKGEEYIYFTVNPGEHTIFSQAENLAETQISVKEGDIAFLQQDPFRGNAMARNNIYKIEEHLGKFHVKKLKLGSIVERSQ